MVVRLRKATQLKLTDLTSFRTLPTAVYSPALPNSSIPLQPSILSLRLTPAILLFCTRLFGLLVFKGKNATPADFKYSATKEVLLMCLEPQACLFLDIPRSTLNMPGRSRDGLGRLLIASMSYLHTSMQVSILRRMSTRRNPRVSSLADANRHGVWSKFCPIVLLHQQMVFCLLLRHFALPWFSTPSVNLKFARKRRPYIGHLGE